MYKIKTLVLLLLIGLTVKSQNNSVFNDQAFGKNKASIYIGAGAFKRHLDLNRIGYKIQEYSKSAALVIGADFCIHPTASNAYWGMGPYFTAWIGKKEIDYNNQKVERLFSNSTLAVKFTHHASLFVKNKLDVCSGYILGVNLKYYHSYKIDGFEINSAERNSEIVLAAGITITVKYYAFKNLGFYMEGGIGYRINMLNVGFCYKLKTNPKKTNQ